MHPNRVLMTATTCLALLAAQPAFAAPPANDNFASAITIGATPYTDSKSTTEATNEVGEPVTFCGGSYSIWYKYTAPSTGTVIADTFGSSFDTELHAFTGATLATLDALACNDDYSGLLSRMPFAVEAGVTYYIRVNGYGGNRGSVTFHLSSVVAAEHTECPLIGAESGCQTLVTGLSDGTFVLDADANQPEYTPYHGRLIGVQNDSGDPLCAITLYSSNAFNFTTFGVCNSNTQPQPASCPFGTTEYEGPGVTFDRVSNNLGTVSFAPCIPDGDSAYFGIDGFGSATTYACAGDEICGPDNDMDGLINDVDNCPSLPNPDQADLDDDGQGNVCDSIDNAVTLKGSIKVKTEGKQATVKGLIFQSETVTDAPDVSGGIQIGLYDSAFTGIAVTFSAAECIATEKKITCATLDGMSSLKIPLGGLARYKVPYKLKTKDLDPTLPPYFQGPMAIQMTDTATSISRSGTSSADCSTKPNQIVCK